MKNKIVSLVLFIFIFFSLFLPLVSAGYDVPSDYVSWWRYEGNANDESGLYNGTISGATYNATGKFGGDYMFDGINDYISADMVSQISNNFTVSAWIYPTRLTPQAEAYGNTIMATSSLYGVWLLHNNGKIRIYAFGSSPTGSYYETTATPITLNNWSHVVVTAIRNGEGNIYVNGQFLESFTAKNEVAWQGVFGIGDLRLNRGLTHKGDIDEVLVYDRVLSPDEVSQLYEMQVTDTTYPIFLNYWDDNATLINSGTAHFNVTVENTNGTVLLEINNQNYTATNLTANVYNVSVSLTNGTYSYKWHSWGNGTSHLYNFSDTRSYTINNSDTTYPIFSNNLTSIANGSQYSSSNNYQFNITIANTNGTAGIEFNSVNYSLSNISNSFYWNAGSLGAGTYNYYFWSYGNGASHNYNASQTYSYTISKNNTYVLGLTATTPITYGTTTNFAGSGCPTQLTCNLNISNAIYSAGTISANYSTNGNENYTSASSVFSVTINKAIPSGTITNSTPLNLTYPTPITIGLSESNTGDSDLTYTIYRDGISKATGETITLGTGSYNYVLNTTGGQNYTSNSSMDAKTLIVNKNTSTQTSLTFDKTSPQSYTNSITPTCSVITGQGTPVLSLNGTIITSGSPITLGVGTWQFNCSLADNGNYSYAENITTFQITQNNSYVISLDANPSWNVNYGTQTNVTGNGCPSELTCNLYNNVHGVVSNGINVTLGVGTYNYTYNTTGNENYSASEVSNILTISQANGYTNLSLNGAENNLTINYLQQTNITASTSYGTLTIYKNGVDITSTNGENQIYGSGYYNLTAYSSGNENYTSSYKTFWLNITKATPILIFLANGGTSNLTLTYPQQINISASSNVGTIVLNKDGVDYLFYNGLNVTLGAGSYIFRANITGNENYSDVPYSYYNVTINKGNSIVYTYLNNSRSNLTIIAGSSIDINSSLMSGEGIIRLYVNGSLINSGNSLHNSTLFDIVGLFNITTTYEETQNYSSSSETFFVNVTDLIFPSIYYNNGTEISGSNLNRNNIVVNVTALDSESGLKNITIFLYNSTSLINSSNSTTSPLFVNFTNLTDGTYYFNATVYDNAGNKNDTETRTITIDTTNPSLILLSPSTNLVNDDGNISFVYNITDTNNITNCSLILNNEINLTNSSIIKGINSSFQLNDLEAGKYNWSINCFDIAGNTNVSEIRRFTVILIGEFLGNTTDILNVNISNITNFVLDNPSYGRINFSQEIDLSDGADINRNVNISFNRIEINSSALPQLNKSAKLSLYNLTFSNPRLLRDGNICSEPVCIEENYSSGILVFNVTGFSVYSAEETPIILQPPSGGSGGGGGATRQECSKDSDCNKGYSCFNNKCVKLFDIKIIRIDSPIQPGDFLDFTYFVKGMAEIKGDVVIDFRLEKDNKTITTGKDTIYFGTFEEKTETTSMFLSSDIKEGTYTFYVQTDYQGHVTSSQRDIQVVKMPTSNLDVNLLSFPSVKEGQAVNFSFIVGFNKDSPVLVKLKEKIKKGEEIVWENERGIEVNRSMIINEQTGLLKYGDYRFEINAEYENKELKFLYDFSVGKKINYWWFLLLIPVILLLIMFVAWKRKVNKEEAKIKEVLKQLEEKQISEEVKKESEETAEEEVRTEDTTTGMRETVTETTELPEIQENLVQEQTTQESSEKTEKEKSFYQSVTRNNKEEITEETEDGTEENLSEIIGMEVYSDNENIGVVEEVYTEDSETFKLLVKLKEKIAEESGHEKILIKNKYIISVGDIIITDEKIAEQLRNFD
jgi:sporulation protein YlmC with PRC-barrel domain